MKSLQKLQAMKGQIKAGKQSGFTLIELMIVVAIIGILAAIALPAYSKYQAKSKFAAGLSEVSGYKTAFELKTNDGITVSGMAAGSGSDETVIYVPALTTGNCALAATGTTLACTIQKAPTQVNGKVITWTRDATTGAWTCDSDLSAGDKIEYAPPACRG